MTDTALNLRQMLREAISEPITEIVNFRALHDLLVALIQEQLHPVFDDKVNDSPDQTMSEDEPAHGAVAGRSEPIVSSSISNESVHTIRMSPTVRGSFNKAIKKISSIEEINPNVVKASPVGESDDAISEHESEQNVFRK